VFYCNCYVPIYMIQCEIGVGIPYMSLCVFYCNCYVTIYIYMVQREIGVGLYLFKQAIPTRLRCVRRHARVAAPRVHALVPYGSARIWQGPSAEPLDLCAVQPHTAHTQHTLLWVVTHKLI